MSNNNNQQQETPEPKWIQHSLTHTQHALKEVFKNSRFECGACKTCGKSGMRFRCEPCNFDIHRTCGECTISLSSFAHPGHQLQLMEKPKLFHKCDLCQNSVRGMVYRCKECQFFVHPLCSRLPEKLNSHPIHPPHPLKLELTTSKKCDVCGKLCKHWRYCCGECDVHIHIGCLSNRGGSRKTRGEGEEGEDVDIDEFLEGVAAHAETVEAVNKTVCKIVSSVVKVVIGLN